MSDQVRWRVRCVGRVQHVGFRYTAMYLARKLGLTGWVKNLPDGSVLLEAQGPSSRLRTYYLRLKSQPHLHIGKAEISVIAVQRFERSFRVLDG